MTSLYSYLLHFCFSVYTGNRTRLVGDPHYANVGRLEVYQYGLWANVCPPYSSHVDPSYAKVRLYIWLSISALDMHSTFVSVCLVWYISSMVYGGMKPTFPGKFHVFFYVFLFIYVYVYRKHLFLLLFSSWSMQDDRLQMSTNNPSEPFFYTNILINLDIL